jgi:hypothetical protein
MEPEGLEPGRGQLRPHRHLDRVHRLDPGPGLTLGLLAPRETGAVPEAARERSGPVIGWGVLLTIGLPLVALLVVATIVALPLGLGTLLAFGLIYGIGYTGAGARPHRAAPSPSDPVFPGRRAILRVVALDPVLGGLSWFAAVVVSLGARAVAAYRARRRALAPRPRPRPRRRPRGRGRRDRVRRNG